MATRRVENEDDIYINKDISDFRRVGKPFPCDRKWVIMRSNLYINPRLPESISTRLPSSPLLRCQRVAHAATLLSAAINSAGSAALQLWLRHQFSTCLVPPNEALNHAIWIGACSVHLAGIKLS